MPGLTGEAQRQSSRERERPCTTGASKPSPRRSSEMRTEPCSRALGFVNKSAANQWLRLSQMP
eukprot:6821649-Pyramimonas_sp.AAC.1